MADAAEEGNIFKTLSGFSKWLIVELTIRFMPLSYACWKEIISLLLGKLKKFWKEGGMMVEQVVMMKVASDTKL